MSVPSHGTRFLEIVNDAKSRIRQNDVILVKGLLDEGRVFHLVDVREESEWRAGHLPAAIHLGKGIIERDIEKMIPDLDAETPPADATVNTEIRVDNMQLLPDP